MGPASPEALRRLAEFRSRFTIGAHADRNPERPAVVYGGAVVNYATLFGDACRAARHFLGDLGLQPGDRIAVQLANRPEVIVVQAAATLAGLVAVPVNPRFRSGELAHIIADSRAQLLVFEQTGRAEIQRLPELPGLRYRVDVDDPAWRDALARQSPQPPPPASLSMISLRYTSGTTGKPKAARRDLHILDYAEYLQTFAREFDYRAGDVHLCVCPLYHSAPPVFANLTLMQGGTVVLLPKFAPATWLAAVERHHVTTAFVVPTILRALIDHVRAGGRRGDVSSLRSVVVAAARCPEDVKLAIGGVLGEVMYEFYGSTEGSINTIVRPHEFARYPASCGRAFGSTQIRVVDEQGRTCPAGVAGELLIRSDFMAREYENDPDKTRDAFVGGYYRTGDVGYVDDDGYYYIVDRIKDMIISGGVNIYPAEIEACLRAHPGVADAAVVGVPDEYWGESVKACVVMRPAAPRDPGALAAWCSERLADYKRPRRYVFLDELPVTPEGKLPKRLLRDL